MIKSAFLFKYSPYAKNSATIFGFKDHLFLLAQQYAENAGESSLLLKTNNVGSLISRVNGKKLKTNSFWFGDDYLAKSSGLYFRVYIDLQSGYNDFARLLARVYKLNTAKTIEEYAARIASSKYIDENNGDDRELYKNNIIKTYYTLKPTK